MWNQKTRVPEEPLPFPAVPSTVMQPRSTSPPSYVQWDAVAHPRGWEDIACGRHGELFMLHKCKSWGGLTGPSRVLPRSSSSSSSFSSSSPWPTGPVGSGECLPQAHSRGGLQPLKGTFLSTKERLCRPKVLLPFWPIWQREFLNFS